MNTFIELIRTRKKIFLVIASLAIINIGLYIFISYFQYPELETLQSRYIEKRQGRGSGEIDKALIYSRGNTDLETFRAAIPPKRDFMRVVGELFEIASNNGLSITSVGYEPEVIKDRQLLVYGLTFSVAGSYASIKSFTSDIERSREMITIDHISLQSDKSEGDSVKFSIRLSAFFRTESP